VVVEAGPGVGTVTTAMLDRVGSDGSVVAFEMNRTFVAHLRGEIADPPRVKRLARKTCSPGIRLPRAAIHAIRIAAATKLTPIVHVKAGCQSTVMPSWADAYSRSLGHALSSTSE